MAFLHLGQQGVASFWQAALGAADLQQLTPLSRWDMEQAYSPQMPPSKMTIYARHGAYCAAVEEFDAPAFRLSRPEGIATDPQQRMLMEKSAEALHQAAALGRSADSSTGHTSLSLIIKGNRKHLQPPNSSSLSFCLGGN